MELEFKNVTKNFESFKVLDEISFKVKSGQIFGYLGRNGAGKTTSIRVLMDVFGCDSGEILMNGEAFDLKKYRIGYLPEERGMYSKITIYEQLIYFSKLRGATDVGRILRTFKIKKNVEVTDNGKIII